MIDITPEAVSALFFNYTANAEVEAFFKGLHELSDRLVDNALRVTSEGDLTAEEKTMLRHEIFNVADKTFMNPHTARAVAAVVVRVMTVNNQRIWP